MSFFIPLSPQRIHVRFQFRKARIHKAKTMGTFNAQPNYDGTVQVELVLSGVRYGPYSTGITTYRAVWDGRKAPRINQSSRDLIDELATYQKLLEEAYTQLQKRGGPIDGQSVMNAGQWIIQQQRLPQETTSQSPFEVVTLMRVYNEFIAFKEDVMEPNRHKRKEGQIATATFETYSRRWALILGYLEHIKRTKLPIVSVTYPFATSLKEWLIKQRKWDGNPYETASINKVISLLKQLVTYALSKGYIEFNPLESFACRGGSPANPKPLSEDQLNQLETCQLPPTLRRICDSWLVAAELCLHHSDFMELPRMQIIARPGGQRFIQHDRSKQTGSNLLQTVNITPRAERLIEKWGGLRRLYYKDSSVYSKALKKIAAYADLRDDKDKLIGLQFGQGRDTGLTQRAIEGANNTELSKMGGWSKAAYANRYIGNAVDIVEGFTKRSKQYNQN
ncbi:phage integrase SAM-like domain-containing protein [Spirosoma sp. RP8]|uniref:Phage integrase SAM-like domain-containing protein n=1 Tax=Spirosoma liriopis TaxID=2937440 RepID=A0ABT0HVC3_9BACT|nr:phage integrase SAM-like domain-containing protein [Spirosoma liriopis]MCK8496062.1 phage integrase SAM-like domain-containing protein [Spirosoma liriopis]